MPSTTNLPRVPARTNEPDAWPPFRGVARTARDDRRGVVEQFSDDLDRLRRGGDDDARVMAKPQPEHKHVPGFRITPRTELVTPCQVMLRAAQALWLIGLYAVAIAPLAHVNRRFDGL